MENARENKRNGIIHHTETKNLVDKTLKLNHF